MNRDGVARGAALGLVLLHLWTRLPEALIRALPIRVAFVDLLVPLAFAYAAFLAWREPRRFVGVPALFAALAIGVAATPGVALGATSPRLLFKLTTLPYGVALAFTLAVLTSREGPRLEVLKVLAWAGGGLGAVGALAMAAGPSIPLLGSLLMVDPAFLGPGEGMVRLQVLASGPNMLAGALHLTLACALAAWGPAQRTRWGLVTLVLLGLALTQSRLILGALVTLLLQSHWEGHPSPASRTLRGLLTVTTPILAVAVVVSLVVRVLPLGAEAPFISLVPSVYLLRNALAAALFVEHPWVGVGVGRYTELSREARPILEAHFPGLSARFPSGWFTEPHDPHSTFLAYAAEGGLLTALAILTFCFTLGLHVHRTRLGVGDARVVALGAGLLGYVVDGLYFDVLTCRSFWILLGLYASGVALCARNQATARATVSSSGRV